MKSTRLDSALAIHLVLISFAVSLPAQMAQPLQPAPSTELLRCLDEQGVRPEQVLDTDSSGVPILCGTKPQNSQTFSALQAAPLPIGARGWEAIPCVIRPDGMDSFRLEVNVNTNVDVVTLQCNATILPESGGATQVLRDDGQAGDRAARDRIWTSVPLRYNTSWTPAQYFAYDSNSPAGLSFTSVGSIKIKELSGVTNEFLIAPDIGLLSSAIPLTPFRALASNVVVTPHLVNVQGTNQAAQKFMRYFNSNMDGVTKTIYSVVPDSFDFLVFFSIDHLEGVPRTLSQNFNAGIHGNVQVNYTGTGMSPYTNSAWYGSRGKLLSVNILDTASRGTYCANVTHELLHQWLLFTSSSLGLDDGTAHYYSRVGAASLLGGTQFLDSTNGGITINCEEGRSRAHYAPPLDRYMMGLIEASNVPPLRIYGTNVALPFFMCDQYIEATNLVRTVTIDEIMRQHGLRIPGPTNAQRNFSVGFIAESNGRLLTPVELTFYEILAKHYTKPLPASAPAPQLQQNWAPVTRFFGEGVTWRTYVPEFVQPRITSATRVAGPAVTLSGTGFPKASYSLECSTNLADWVTMAEFRPDTNGVFTVTNAISPGAQFYRAKWNE